MTQPEALRLADMLENNYPLEPEAEEAAAGLRRLHEVNQMLVKAAEMALESLSPSLYESIKFTENRQNIAKEALRQALAQPEQEPEWIEDGFGTMWQKCGKKDCGKFVVKIGKVDCWNGDCPENKPKREWVGLTDEEMHECWDSPLTPLGMKHARMIEAKLKEKNT